MARIPRESPSGYVIFCDDIRVENTNKTILIGVYSGEMNLFYDTLPVFIPKLCMSVMYFDNIDHEMRVSSIEVYLPGQDGMPIIKVDIPKEQMESTRAPPPDSDDIDLLKGMAAQVNLQNVQINQSGRVKVIARLGNDVLRLGSMYIHLKTMDEGRQMGLFA